MLTTVLHPAERPSGLPPLLIAHGLFGSARNWGVIARRLAESRDVLAVDMRNHGTSPRSEVHRYPEMAADLAEVIEAQGGLADVVGHSMGGKAAMMLALTRPERVRRLVVPTLRRWPMAMTSASISTRWRRWTSPASPRAARRTGGWRRCWTMRACGPSSCSRWISRPTRRAGG
ncbi:alpha/beta fold hydrolase [Cereibacter changlensis]|uniref:alpha/beta fold hydrolase n=1 Tax=Cereibacter changlensis TaxID=402884 RepID=UPI00200A8F3A|nr:alpha/beta fold hydrolase [Cereibacter changlensis]